MTQTSLARAIVEPIPVRKSRPERVATRADWDVLAAWEVAVPWAVLNNGQAAACYVEADVDAGQTGELRLRASNATPESASIDVSPSGVVYFNNFPDVGPAASVLGQVLNEWEIYDSVGNAGFGIRSPGQVAVVAEPTATSGANVLRITAQNVGGQHYSGGVKLYVPRTYGEFEFRVRVSDDASQVTSGVVLLWPQTIPWPQGGEIDWWETFDNRDTRTPTKGYVHRLNPAAVPPYDASDDQVISQVTYSGIDQSAWHKVVGTWLPNELSIDIDNGSSAYELASDPSWIPDWPMELTFQLDAWSNTPPAAPVTMDVDYVLVRKAIVSVDGRTPPVTITGHTRNRRIGFLELNAAQQVVYLEGRRGSDGAPGSVRVLSSALTVIDQVDELLITGPPGNG